LRRHPKRIVIIVGPTAVGKTDVSIRVAQAIDGEIVNADAMQVYREVSIASNKPPKAVLRKIPHHLIGTVPVAASYDVAAYNQAAYRVVEDIVRRGKIPVVVGGSGLYVRVLLDGIFDEGASDRSIRRRLEDEATQLPSGHLHARLQKVDPKAAAKIHPNDTKRTIRALEVYETLHRTISDLRGKHEGLWKKYDVKLFCLDRKRPALYRRIDERVEEMFEQGLLEEIRTLTGLPLSRTAEGMIGVKEVHDYSNGKTDLARAKRLIKQKTRNYAKRQMTWFRKESRLTWIMIDDGQTAEDVAQRILKDLSG